MKHNIVRIILNIIIILFNITRRSICTTTQTCTGNHCIPEEDNAYQSQFVEHVSEGYEEGMELPEHLKDVNLNWGMAYDDLPTSSPSLATPASMKNMKEELERSNFYAFVLDNGDPPIVDKTLASDKEAVFFKHKRTNCTIVAALFHSTNLISFTDNAAKGYLKYNRFHNYKINQDYDPNPKATDLNSRHKYELSREVSIPTNYALINFSFLLVFV